MYRLWPSAKRVSKARVDFPEPETPVMTVIFPLGIRQSIFLRLWDLAPMISIYFSITSIIIHKPIHYSNSPVRPREALPLKMGKETQLPPTCSGYRVHRSAG